MNKNGVGIPTTNGQDEGFREFGIIHFETKVRIAKGKKRQYVLYNPIYPCT